MIHFHSFMEIDPEIFSTVILSPGVIILELSEGEVL